MVLQPWRRRYKQSSMCKNWEFYIDCLLKWRSSVFCVFFDVTTGIWTLYVIYFTYRWIWTLIKVCNRECEWPSLGMMPVLTCFIRYANVGDSVVSRPKVAALSWRVCSMSWEHDDVRECALRISIADRAEWSSLISYWFPPKPTVPGTHGVQYVDSDSYIAYSWKRMSSPRHSVTVLTEVTK
jgi:hypothetical protein